MQYLHKSGMKPGGSACEPQVGQTCTRQTWTLQE